MIYPLQTEGNFKQQLKPRTTCLEADHYIKAKDSSQNIDNENYQWKRYLSELATLGFMEWLQQQIPDIKVEQKGVNLEVGKFKVQLIVVDNLVDNFVTVPQGNITSPRCAAHFYVLVEVLEEIEQLRLHGFIQHSELSKLQIDANNSCYQIQLSTFDNHINNLLVYTRFLKVETIPLPKLSDKIVSNLSQWWSGKCEAGWKSLEEILIPQQPVWGYLKNVVRKDDTYGSLSDFAVKRGKLINFGILPDNQPLVLTLSMRMEENQEIGVLTQIRTQNEYCLPQGLKLKVTLNQNTEQPESNEAIARQDDKIIQLSFSESVGKQFRVEATYKDAIFTEEFML